MRGTGHRRQAAVLKATFNTAPALRQSFLNQVFAKEAVSVSGFQSEGAVTVTWLDANLRYWPSKQVEKVQRKTSNLFPITCN